jgi:hypothetical protein
MMKSGMIESRWWSRGAGGVHVVEASQGLAKGVCSWVRRLGISKRFLYVLLTMAFHVGHYHVLTSLASKTSESSLELPWLSKLHMDDTTPCEDADADALFTASRQKPGPENAASGG